MFFKVFWLKLFLYICEKVVKILFYKLWKCCYIIFRNKVVFVEENNFIFVRLGEWIII